MKIQLQLRDREQLYEKFSKVLIFLDSDFNSIVSKGLCVTF